MILAPGVPGVAFGTAADGDGRSDTGARKRISAELDIDPLWATVDQIHGSTVAVVESHGYHGEADGLFTTIRGLPLTVATADCVPVAIVGNDAVSIVHAGWRGVASGIVSEAVRLFATHGTEPTQAVIGPHIGPCCYEVGDEVVAGIGGFTGTTSWGTRSVSLADAIDHQLGVIPALRVGGCTMEDPLFASHRENATPDRQVAVVWIP